MAPSEPAPPELDVRAVIDYGPAWPELFAALGRDLRAALGGVALSSDHVGSTAVPGPEQVDLFHRDYLRADPTRAREYAAFKRSVAHLLRTDRQAYVDANDA